MKLSPRTLTILKYSFAILLLCLVVRKVGFTDILAHMKEVSVGEGLMAIILSTFAQYFSAMRMRYFFAAAGVRMGKYFAVVLYYVGAFYNFLLPGGIGGDAYKIMLVRKRLEMPAVQGIRLMVADRASGLCVLMLTMFLGMYLCGLGQIVEGGNLLLLLAALVTPAAYIVGSKRLLKQLPHDMVGSLRFSAFAQCCWIATLALLWRSVGHGEHLTAYITLYCVASIASMIPLSVGGLGLREMTYFYGAKFMQDYVGLDVNADVGIAISLSMFALTFISSLPGLFWLHRVSKLPIAPAIKPDQYLGETHVRTRHPSREDWT